MRASFSARALLVFVVTGCAQSPSGSEREALSEVTFALSAAPADAACLQIKVVGTRTVVARFDLRDRANLTFTLRGLPLGTDVFTGSAYRESCNALRRGCRATWLSAPVSALVTAREPAQVELRMQQASAEQLELSARSSLALMARGRADVTVTFAAADDAGQGDGGDDAGVSDGGDADAAVDAGTEPDAGVDPGVVLQQVTQSPLGSGYYLPMALLDPIHDKLLIVASTFSGTLPMEVPTLVRCEPGAVNCTVHNIAAGRGIFSGNDPSAAIDFVNQKLLTVATDFPNNMTPWLYRCDLDGNDCTARDISTGQLNNGKEPEVLIDAANGRLLAVTRHDGNGAKPALLRCELDGSGCSNIDISAGQGGNSGWNPSALLDPDNGKLLVVTRNGANGDRPGLFRCNLDGSACTHTDISAGQGAGSGAEPTALIDGVAQKLLVVTTNAANGGGLSLFRCELDGSACTHRVLSLDSLPYQAWDTAAALDAQAGKLLVVSQTSDGQTRWEQHLLRCNADGSGCTRAGLPPGALLSSPSMVADPARRTMYAATYGLWVYAISY